MSESEEEAEQKNSKSKSNYSTDLDSLDREYLSKQFFQISGS
jgi:hypothetical protein